MVQRGKTIWFAGGLLVIALLVWWLVPGFHNQKDPLGQYDYVKVTRMDLIDKVEASGNVFALEKKDLYADYEGTVEAVNVKAGDSVKKGAILLTIHSTSLKDQWEEANSALKQAEINAGLAAGQLATELYLNKINKQNALQLENHTHQVALYKEQAKQAKQRLNALNAKNDGYYIADNEKLLIRAPFDGQVAWVNVQQGEKVTPELILATVIQPETLGVEAQVDENDIHLVQTGQQVLIESKVSGQESSQGVVTEISTLGQSDGELVHFPVRVQLEKESASLKPGMSVDVTVLANERHGVLAIPTAAVETKDNRNFVKLRRGKEIVTVSVTLGQRYGKYWEVKSGLTSKDTVAIAKLPSSSGSVVSQRVPGLPRGGR